MLQLHRRVQINSAQEFGGINNRVVLNNDYKKKPSLNKTVSFYNRQFVF